MPKCRKKEGIPVYLNIYLKFSIYRECDGHFGYVHVYSIHTCIKSQTPIPSKVSTYTEFFLKETFSQVVHYIYAVSPVNLFTRVILTPTL